MGGAALTFDSFRDEIKSRIERMHGASSSPDSTLPGYLFVERVDGAVDAEPYPVAGMTEVQKQVLARILLPIEIGRRPARRFCWVMPGWKGDPADEHECLVMIFGERGRTEALIADVVRFQSRAPRLEGWQAAPEASGIFVAPLVEALAAESKAVE